MLVRGPWRLRRCRLLGGRRGGRLGLGLVRRNRSGGLRRLMSVVLRNAQWWFGLFLMTGRCGIGLVLGRRRLEIRSRCGLFRITFGRRGIDVGNELQVGNAVDTIS